MQHTLTMGCHLVTSWEVTSYAALRSCRACTLPGSGAATCRCRDAPPISEATRFWSAWTFNDPSVTYESGDNSVRLRRCWMIARTLRWGSGSYHAAAPLEALQGFAGGAQLTPAAAQTFDQVRQLQLPALCTSSQKCTTPFRCWHHLQSVDVPPQQRPLTQHATPDMTSSRHGCHSFVQTTTVALHTSGAWTHGRPAEAEAGFRLYSDSG